MSDGQFPDGETAKLTIPKWNEMGVYLLASCPTLICQIGRRLGSVFEPLLQK